MALAESETEFLLNKPKIILFRRYKDDIFAMFKGTEEQACGAIRGSYTHHDLKITSVISRTYLDLVIYKGQCWRSKYRLDLRTHQEVLNKYMYLPHKSSHPVHSKKGFITSDLLVFVLNSSDKEAYLEVRHKFYVRIRNRGYPRWSLLHCFQRVNYTQAERLQPPAQKEELPPTIYVPTYH
ncbi:unnamed protein product, partial [Choristocarpus tenellus]